MNLNDYQHPQDKSQMRVLSYALSASDTNKNKSIQRQVHMTRQWCQREGYTLNESDELVDEGVATFSGIWVEVGKLLTVKQKLESGEIAPGSMLIVESFGRIGQQGSLKPLTLLLSLISKGLVVVTLNDGRTWGRTTMTDLTPFLTSVHKADREFRESYLRSLRVRAGLKAKRTQHALQT